MSVSVSVLTNGPLKLVGVKTLTFAGEPQEFDGDVYLCRCGGSANMPFCDGTHGKNDFDGSFGKGDVKDVVVWEGETLRTRFNPNICMHARYCKPLGDLREREKAGDTKAATEIARVVETCPSSALSWEAKGAVAEPASNVDAPDVEVVEGGEVRIRASFEIDTDLLSNHDGVRAALCRCGQSKNKPWCDASHAGKARKGWR